jgi:alanine transaminase
MTAMAAFLSFSLLVGSALAAIRRQDISSKITGAEYAVRGEIVIMSQEIEKELASGNHSYSFDKLIACNIGNPQAVGQEPLTYHRQVLSLLTNPSTIDDAEKTGRYLTDVIARAREFTPAVKFGAYTHSKGAAIFREKIADYIHTRDGSVLPRPDTENIYITDGASKGIQLILELMVTDEKDVILIPIPQYPLYSATVTRLGGTWVGYEMKEDYSASSPAWELDLSVIEKLYKEEVKKGNRVRGIVIINPGNPTGNILSRSNLEDLQKFCEQRDVSILADEVYQENIYSPQKSFVSMREVVLAKQSKVELFSFHSISKGYYGECGLRGGYMELLNVAPDVNDEIYKLSSMTLCSNTLAQAMTASILHPPQPGSPSHPLFQKEKNAILDGLKRKAILVEKELNKIHGYNVMPIEGAMYAFPMVRLPKKYIEHAEQQGSLADSQYCKDLLKALGVIMVPGNGFGQRANTFHFRMTILPKESDLVAMLKGLTTFQHDLYAKYGDPDKEKIEL